MNKINSQIELFTTDTSSILTFEKLQPENVSESLNDWSFSLSAVVI